MPVFEVVSPGDRRSLLKRYDRKSKHDAITELLDFRDCDQRRIDLLEKKLAEFLGFVEGAPVGSGVCCCGGDMTVQHHGDHTPVDQWDNSVRLWGEEINKLLEKGL